MKNAVLMFTATAAVCLAADPFVGTWKPAQFDKWKISPGGRAEDRKSRVVTTELIAKDTYRETTTTFDGKPVESEPPITYALDGKEHMTGNNTVLKHERVDERHSRVTSRSEKGTVVDTLTISPDGKTATVTRKGTGPTSGRPIDELFIYEKQ